MKFYQVYYCNYFSLPFQNQFVKNRGTLLDGEKVMRIDPGRLVTVHTSNGHQFKAQGVVLTAGLWASKLLKPLGLDLPLKVDSITDK